MKTANQKLYQEIKSMNGYSNYPTWAVKLWIDNDEISQKFWYTTTENIKHIVQTCPPVRDGIWDEEQGARYTLAETLKEEIESRQPDLPASMYTDLLGWAICYVNWDEIAESLLADIED